jgi:RNA polymerase sigma-70 factor (ECF subfamily)
LRTRDEFAFTELVARYERRLLATVVRITGNFADAEEVVQDTFVKVFKHIESFRGDSLFRTWLTRIAMNEALMKIRRTVRMYLSLDEDGEDGIGSAARRLRASGESPEDACSLRQAEGLMLSLLHQIRRPYQPMMKLCIQMGLSQSEVAQHLNLKPSTVRSRLSRGRKELREAFAQHCVRRKQAPVSATTLRHRQRQVKAQREAPCFRKTKGRPTFICPG